MRDHVVWLFTHLPVASGTIGVGAAHHATLPIGEIEWLLILASAATVAARCIRIPYTVALVLIGLLVSSLGLLAGVKPTSDIILLVFLPPLLFEAALDVDLEVLGRALPAIVTLAIPGVVLSTVLLGFGLAWLTPLAIWPALLFGAFISATDPVAVVASFRRLRAPALLSTVIEGESLFNDGTALVLAALLLGAAQTGQFHAGETLLRFVWSLVGAGLVGTATAFVVSHITRLLDDHMIETTLSAALAYGSFLLSDRVGASGAVAVVLAGLVYGNYGRQLGLSDESRRFLDDFWGYIGFLANAVLFILIGLEITPSSLIREARWVLLTIALVLVVRALIVYTLTLSMRRISFAYGHVLFWGGLRGGVALAVAISLPRSMPGYTLLLALTFGVVLFTILVQGLTIEPLARRLRLLPETAGTGSDPAGL